MIEFSLHSDSVISSNEIDILMLSVQQSFEKLSRDNVLVLIAAVSGVPMDTSQVAEMGYHILSTNLKENLLIKDPNLVTEVLSKLGMLLNSPRLEISQNATKEDPKPIEDFIEKIIKFMFVIHHLPPHISQSREIRKLCTISVCDSFLDIISVSLSEPEFSIPDYESLLCNLFEYIASACHELKVEISNLVLFKRSFIQIIDKVRVSNGKLKIGLRIEELFNKVELLCLKDQALCNFYLECCQYLFLSCSCVLAELNVDVSELLHSTFFFEYSDAGSYSQLCSLKILLVMHEIFLENADIMADIRHRVACYSSENFHDFTVDAEFIIDVNDSSSIFSFIEFLLFNCTFEPEKNIRLVLNLCRNLNLSHFSSYSEFFSRSSVSHRNNYEVWTNILMFCVSNKLYDDIMEIIMYDIGINCETCIDCVRREVREMLLQIFNGIPFKYNRFLTLILGDSLSLSSDILDDLEGDIFYSFIVLRYASIEQLLSATDLFLYLYRTLSRLLTLRLEKSNGYQSDTGLESTDRIPLYSFFRSAFFFTAKTTKEKVYVKRLPYLITPFYLVEKVLLSNNVEIAGHLYCDLLRIPKELISQPVAIKTILDDIDSGSFPFCVNKLDEVVQLELGWASWSRIASLPMMVNHTAMTSKSTENCFNVPVN